MCNKHSKWLTLSEKWYLINCQLVFSKIGLLPPIQCDMSLVCLEKQWRVIACQIDIVNKFESNKIKRFLKQYWNCKIFYLFLLLHFFDIFVCGFELKQFYILHIKKHKNYILLELNWNRVKQQELRVFNFLVVDNKTSRHLKDSQRLSFFKHAMKRELVK